jgi:hypothetical protein
LFPRDKKASAFSGMRAASDNHGEILIRAAPVIYVLDREIKLLFMQLWIAGFWGEPCL